MLTLVIAGAAFLYAVVTMGRDEWPYPVFPIALGVLFLTLLCFEFRARRARARGRAP